jgi:hypothetical protein
MQFKPATTPVTETPGENGSTGTTDGEGSTGTAEEEGMTETPGGNGSTGTTDGEGSTGTAEEEGTTETPGGNGSTGTTDGEGSTGTTEEEEATETPGGNGSTGTADLPAITSLTLFNAETDCPIGLLADGDVINLSWLQTCQLSIVATTQPERVGSVVFKLNGQVIQTENQWPYALKGDENGGTDLKPWSPEPGNYSLTVTPYTQKSGQGTKGSDFTINFKIKD